MKRIVVAALALVAGTAWAESSADFPASATVVVTGGEGLHRVEVPFEAHRGARPDLADLRMFNGRGDALPFAFAGLPPAAPATPEAVALPLFPVRAVPRGTTTTTAGDVSLDVRADKNGTLISLRTSPKGKAAPKPAERPAAWVADASAIADPVGALVVDWAAEAGSEIARVSVEASEDLKSWQPLASGTVLALEQGGRKLSQPRLEFPARKVKYLRVTSPTGGFVLAGLRAESTKPAPAPELHKVTVGGRSGPPGEYEYDLQAAVPVVRVQLLLAEPNAVAPAEIFSRNESGEWRAVGTATFYRLSRGGEELRSKPVAVSSSPARYWRVRIDPKAGIPRDAPRLEAGYRPRQVVFASRGEGPYLLAFGNEQAKRADLPLATLIPGYERDAEYKLPAAKVAAVGMHGPAQGFSFSRLWQGDRGRKAVLWAVLIGGVVLLGFMAWRLSSKAG